MNEQITVTVNGTRLSASVGTVLSELINGEQPCGGHGRCGKCKVIAKGTLSPLTEAEQTLLSKEELKKGVRLACLTYALGECEIETLVSDKHERIITDGIFPALEIKASFARYGVAIDVGTTTLAARLYGARGNLLADASCLNPQQGLGADVISRIEAALDGKAERLAKVIREALDDILSELARRAKINTREIDGVVITGNTVMLSLLVGESVELFSHAPFDTKRLFGETLTAKKLDLFCLLPDTPIYLPPCISAFVGADTTCAILATELCERKTAMLADIGTNGELALWKNGKLTVCSTAAGPAFEGVGISMGMRGSDGAIDKVWIENGCLRAHIIGGGSPVGICGSGLVDAIACMLDLEILDESGYLENEKFTVQAPVSLTPKDIRMLQLAKSAICAGILTLTETENVNASTISTLSIAGGFGSYLNQENAIRIGLIPTAFSGKLRAVGNAALAGAALLLLNRDVKEKATVLARGAHTLELSANPVFSERYMSGMILGEV